MHLWESIPADTGGRRSSSARILRTERYEGADAVRLWRIPLRDVAIDGL